MIRMKIRKRLNSRKTLDCQSPVGDEVACQEGGLSPLVESRVEANDPQVKSMIVYAPEGIGDGPEDQRVIEDYQDILTERLAQRDVCWRFPRVVTRALILP